MKSLEVGIIYGPEDVRDAPVGTLLLLLKGKYAHNVGKTMYKARLGRDGWILEGEACLGHYTPEPVNDGIYREFKLLNWPVSAAEFKVGGTIKIADIKDLPAGSILDMSEWILYTFGTNEVMWNYKYHTAGSGSTDRGYSTLSGLLTYGTAKILSLGGK